MEPIISTIPGVRTEDNPMSETAAKRKSWFPSIEFAKQYFSSKPTMKNWYS
jgi:hypothetical protein